jgi:membrane protein implicated in regulation of membrane protease activity
MFMLWLGLSAILVGLISSVVVWSWQAQLIAFAIFAIASVPAWRHFARKVEKPADSPFLNRRADGYVGRVFTLERPIVDGVGTVRIDDTVWRVTGPDCPAGSRVRVAHADGANLSVEAT